MTACNSNTKSGVRSSAGLEGCASLPYRASGSLDELYEACQKRETVSVAGALEKPPGAAAVVSNPEHAGSATEPKIAPDLPPDYRARVARAILTEYLQDGVGPAEITQPNGAVALLGASTGVIVRYAASPRAAARQNVFINANGPARMRCISVSVNRGVFTLGQIAFTARRPKIDPTTCGEKLTFTPYTELEQMAGKARGCRERGEDRCLLSTNMPEAEARRFINRYR